MKENQQIEWKETWRDEFLKWICGFANAEGGALHIGRNDRGAVVGVPNAARLLEEIPNKVRDLLGILVEVNLRREGGGEYLEVVTPAYPSPISYRGHYYQRSGSTLQELKGAALDRFLLRKQGRTWDGVPVPNVAVKDLSGLAIKRFRTLAGRSGRVEPGTLREPAPALIDKLRLREGAHLKRAALLLFHQDPERFVNGAFVKIEFSARSPIWLTTTRCMEICSPKSQRRSSFCEPNTSRPPSATRASSASSIFRCPTPPCASPCSTRWFTATMR